MGETHARAYQAVPDIEVAAIYGRTESRAGPIADRVGTLATTDLDDILDDPTVDAVDVCLPSRVHADFVVAALNAGKHVFCETPFALARQDAERMMDAARANDRLLLVALLMRSVAAYRHIQRAVASGELGRPLAVYAYRLGSHLRRESSAFKEHYGDPTTELMTFDFDVLNWMFGLPKEVYATATATPDGIPGHVIAALRYDDLVANVEASGVMPIGFPFSVGIRVIGEAKALELSTRFSEGIPKTTFISYAQSSQDVQLRGHDPYVAECQYFVECIRGNADPHFLSAERALEALQLSIAVQDSLKQQKVVRVETKT
jgi:UDP-N-acetylglucosamine 3-dehydrogenase